MAEHQALIFRALAAVVARVDASSDLRRLTGEVREEPQAIRMERLGWVDIADRLNGPSRDRLVI